MAMVSSSVPWHDDQRHVSAARLVSQRQFVEAARHVFVLRWLLQVPRMLWRAEDMATLERQVLASDDAGLLTWWARACEASSNFTQAINCYQRAGKHLDY
jgi:hypothetical protein